MFVKILANIWEWVSIQIIGKIKWDFIKGIFRKGKYWDLTPDDWVKLITVLKDNHFIILIHRKTHLTTYLISIANFIKTGKWGYWSHALMNLEGSDPTIDGYNFIEATGRGVHYSKFDAVFNCDAVCLLTPKEFSPEEWTACIDKLRTELGKPYDTLFDLSEDQHLSCVELVRVSLEASPEYDKNFAAFENIIKETKNLTPQMFYDCEDFIKVLEIRR